MSSCTNDIGIRSEGDCENKRNRAGADVFAAIIREAFNVEDVICGHHIIYEQAQKANNGFVYHDPQEIPSADALIFNHDVARKIWGEADYMSALKRLVCEPIETRDALLRKMYNSRQKPMGFRYGGDEEPTYDV